LAEALDAPLATLDARLSRASGPRCRFQLPPPGWAPGQSCTLTLRSLSLIKPILAARTKGRRATLRGDRGPQGLSTLPATMRGWKLNRLGSLASMVASTAPAVWQTPRTPRRALLRWSWCGEESSGQQNETYPTSPFFGTI